MGHGNDFWGKNQERVPVGYYIGNTTQSRISGSRRRYSIVNYHRASCQAVNSKLVSRPNPGSRHAVDENDGDVGNGRRTSGQAKQKAEKHSPYTSFILYTQSRSLFSSKFVVRALLAVFLCIFENSTTHDLDDFSQKQASLIYFSIFDREPKAISLRHHYEHRSSRNPSGGTTTIRHHVLHVLF